MVSPDSIIGFPPSAIDPGLVKGSWVKLGPVIQVKITEPSLSIRTEIFITSQIIATGRESAILSAIPAAVDKGKKDSAEMAKPNKRKIFFFLKNEKKVFIFEDII